MKLQTPLGAQSVQSLPVFRNQAIDRMNLVIQEKQRNNKMLED